jgi:glycine oxidase
VEVTIVGAGVAGCAIAWELSSRGAAVTVVDTRGIGKGATYASAGILAPRIEGSSPELLRLALCSLGMYDSFVSRLKRDAERTIEYERSGTLQVALRPEENAELQQSAAELSAAHIPHSWLDARHAQRVEPNLTSDVVGALLIPEHGYVSVAALVDALADAARRRGARFVTTPVDEVRGGRRPRVITRGEAIEADVVVIAAGSWSSDLTASAVRPRADAAGSTGTAPVRPVRGQLLHLQMPSRVASRVLWGHECYIVPWRDGSVLVGATVEEVGFDESATVAGVQHLTSAATHMLPVLAGATFAGVRVGLRPATPDALPAIGRASSLEGVVYATGHYRNGVLLAPLTAVLVGDLVLENRERNELSLTRPERLGL